MAEVVEIAEKWLEWSDNNQTDSHSGSNRTGQTNIVAGWTDSRILASTRHQSDQPTNNDRIEKRWAEQRLDDDRDGDTNADTNRQTTSDDVDIQEDRGM